MPTRQVRDESPPTDPEDVPPPSREPVLIGDILFDTLAELARRTAPAQPLRLPAQRPHP
ncbi:hypothetical protein ACIPYS_22990 [Kitasatospora sp. NPDC089913]|uniref:hypothetical protein n=1 Tax=Streptomycetaceae TaxID=2062 RepID=UPI00087D0D08|nr:hypothetical protein [Streptomyces sp. TLI_053]SDT71424.1 hypothetical protein SAMN05216371_4118 [Streptomyces sp. TLI_053]